MSEQNRHALSVGEFIDRMQGRGIEIMILIIALPFCQPIPLVGLSTLFGFLLIALGFCVCMGWDAWFPENIKARELPKGFMEMMQRYALPSITWIEKWVKPRFLILSESKPLLIIHGINIIILALILSLPLPIPFSNVVAAWPIVLIAIGLIERDGVLIAIAYGLSAFSYTFFIAIFFLGKEAIKRWIFGQ